jgi:hypothetical protein
MKTPRVTHFHPDANTPTLKSSLDNMPSIQKRHVPQAPLVDQPVKTSLSVTAVIPNKTARTVVPPAPSQHISAKRTFLRRTFDFYEDQIAFLKRESLQERLAGREKGMNEMVREAIDEWINKRTLRK